jgi:hypothetical protein
LLQKSLMVLANSDSVALPRFAAESGDDGAARRPDHGSVGDGCGGKWLPDRNCEFSRTVGLNWWIVGVSNFSSNSGETDMMMRNTSTGAFEVYDISNNAITGARPLGQVGLDWQAAGDRSQSPDRAVDPWTAPVRSASSCRRDLAAATP